MIDIVFRIPIKEKEVFMVIGGGMVEFLCIWKIISLNSVSIISFPV